MWYKLFSQLVGQILLWIREPNICDWVRHLNQLPGKWEITPGAVSNTENQKSGKGGQRSSVWERRHPMHTDSEIIALPKIFSPTFAWRYRVLFTEVIRNLSIDFGGLGIRPAWGKLSCNWVWNGLAQEGLGREGARPLLETRSCTCGTHKVVEGTRSTPPTAPRSFQSPSLRCLYICSSFTDWAWWLLLPGGRYPLLQHRVGLGDLSS